MFEKLSEKACKAIQYLSTPFAYPSDALRLAFLTFANRPLVRELVQLTPHRRWYQSNGFRTVIDVGAYIGAYALAIRHMLPGARIYAFEPQPENYQKLLQNLPSPQHLRAFCTALGEQRGETSFWQSEFSPSSSVLPMADLHKQTFPQTAGGRQVTLPIAPLDDFLDEMELTPPVLLKLDVQGYEEKVLLGAKRLLPLVDYVLTEVSFRPLYEGQASFDQLNGLLRASGFTYAGNFETLVSPFDGSILQADALFVRQK